MPWNLHDPHPVSGALRFPQPIGMQLPRPAPPPVPISYRPHCLISTFPLALGKKKLHPVNTEKLSCTIWELRMEVDHESLVYLELRYELQFSSYRKISVVAVCSMGRRRANRTRRHSTLTSAVIGSPHAPLLKGAAVAPTPRSGRLWEAGCNE